MEKYNTKCQHLEKTLEFIKIQSNLSDNAVVELNGKELTIPLLFALSSSKGRVCLQLRSESEERMKLNAKYLKEKLENGTEIYGVNTGYGGSADVRSSDVIELQKSLVRLLNAGFGDTLPSNIVRPVMAVRANSLSLGYSGIRPATVQLLIDMLNNDIIPVVPKRGTVSASGDLMPTSYIAAAMMGKSDTKVHKNGVLMPATQALRETNLEPVTFQAKEALAVVNSASFASSLGSIVLYNTNIAVVLTQIATALSVESLRGRTESFHPTIHSCLPHPGQIEVAKNIFNLLKGSKFAIQYGERPFDRAGILKQDRYALRTSPQWLGPVVETVMESIRRVTIELNSANDNPLIDHVQDEILHCGNFQATAVTVAMDQCRQSIQLCGKLLMAQFQELVNGDMNNGLTPNLAGSDITTDFGFKGMDIAMASYQSELDYLGNNVTNHVLSAELHNQAVNSLAFVSARYTEQALEMLQMMIANIYCAQLQAIDLRHMKNKAEVLLDAIFQEHGVKLNEPVRKAFPWYLFVFAPKRTLSQLFEIVEINEDVELDIMDTVTKETSSLISAFRDGTHIQEVEGLLGAGTWKIYSFFRREMQIPFYHAQSSPDVLLEKIHAAVTQHKLADIFVNIFENCAVSEKSAKNGMRMVHKIMAA